MAAINEVDYIWKNGELLPWAEATTHVLTHALHYGTAVFEGIRCYQTESGSSVFRLREHIERLLSSGRMIMMEIPYSADQLVEAAINTIQANKLQECYIRPLAYRGYGSMGVNPTAAPVDAIIAVWPWGDYLGDTALKEGVKVAISTWRQRSINALPGAVKSSASYLNSGLANIEAVSHGYSEAVLLNENGLVAEGSGENIFIVKKKVISTPPLSDGILEGLVRDSIMQIGRELGYEVRERSLARTELYAADEVFFTGTAAEVTPINSVDDRQIGPPGPVTLELQARFFDIAKGRVPEYEHWLTRI
ncbi:MAG: branched-chain amino acid transaminase [Coriobacteriia bacterium]|nr:branched-chain amino acid transaminase [Coriobacteriia bacterium]